MHGETDALPDIAVACFMLDTDCYAIASTSVLSLVHADLQPREKFKKYDIMPHHAVTTPSPGGTPRAKCLVRVTTWNEQVLPPP